MMLMLLKMLLLNAEREIQCVVCRVHHIKIECASFSRYENLNIVVIPAEYAYAVSHLGLRLPEKCFRDERKGDGCDAHLFCL